MSTQTYHHKDLKAALIRQGLTLLDAEGYQSFTLRKVAMLCGVSQTAPYRHFKNKDDLIGAITAQAMERFADSLETAVKQNAGDPGEQLKEMGVAYVRFFVENPEYLRLLFLTDTRIRVRFQEDERVKMHNNAFGILYTVTQRVAQAHPEASLTQEDMILYSWGLVHGISTLIVSGELPNNAETLRRAENIIRGLF